MPAHEFVGYEVSAAIAKATLGRLEKLNAFHYGMLHDLREMLADAAGRDDVRARILTGAGRAFCVGRPSTGSTWRPCAASPRRASGPWPRGATGRSIGWRACRSR